MKVRIKRRRVRQIAPVVLRAIREELLTGASAPQVLKALSQRDDLPPDSLPSERTISNIAREMRPDVDSVPWKVGDGDPETVSFVLEVLAEVVRRTQGLVVGLTRDEATLLPVMRRAMLPRWTKLPSDAARAWQTFAWTRFYLSWVRSEEDELDFALALAAMQSDRPSVPITLWRRVTRVLDAAQGWTPPELLEVQR